MIEVGTVGAVFTIRDDASSTLQRLADEFNRLQETIDKIKESMGSIGGAEDGPLAKMREQFKLVGDSGMDASRVIQEAFGKVDGSVDSTIARVDALKRSIGEAASAASLFHMSSGGGMGGAGEHEAHGGRAGFMHHLEQHAGGLGHLAGSLVGGPAGAAIGAGVLGWEWFKEAGSVAQAENNLRLAGVDDAGIAKADAEAGNYAKYGMSKLEALNAIRATMGPLNVAGGTDTGIDAAAALLPQMAQFSQLARVMKGEGAGDAGAQMYELIKGGELRNKLTPEEMGKFIEDYAQVYEGTGGKVDPKTYYQGLKYAKSAGGFFSDDFVKNYLPGIEAEEGGSTAGTMLMTSASAFLGQRFKKPALGQLRQMGIYDEHDELKNKDSLVQNPFEWMQNTFIPALKAAGFTTQDQQIEEVEKLTSRNSAEAAALLGIRPGNVERTAAAIGRADTLHDATTKIGANDPLAAQAQVTAGIANLATALGGPFIPQITGGLSNLAGGINAAADALKVHTLPDGGKEMLGGPNPVLKALNDKAAGLSDSFWKWLIPSDKPLLSGGDIHPENIAPGLDPAAKWIHDRAASWSGLPANPSGPHPVSGPIAAPPVTISSPIQAPLTGQASVNVTVNNNVTAAIQTVKSEILGEIRGMFAGMVNSIKGAAMNAAASHDGRADPAPTDSSGLPF
jgi:hypothetical protein